MAYYQVLVPRKVRAQLQYAPPELRGQFDGILAFLRVDPSSVSFVFPVIAGPDYHTIVFANGRAFLEYEIVEEQSAVVLIGLVWLGEPG